MTGGEGKFKKRQGSLTSGKVSLKVKVKKAVMKRKPAVDMDEASHPRKKASRKIWPFLKVRAEKGTKEAKEEVVEEVMEKAEAVAARNIILAAKVEQQKKIIMWSGVIFFTVLFGSLWIYNARQILRPVDNGSSSDLSGNGINTIGDELTNKMKELKNNLQTINEFMKNNASSTTATSTAENIPGQAGSNLSENKISSTTKATSTINISQQEIEELRQKLNEMENKINKSKK